MALLDIPLEQPATVRQRRGISFSVSGCLHGAILAWVILSGAARPPRAKSIYDQEIRPHEKEIVWYSLRDKLPEIRPAETPLWDPRPPRARQKAPQTMVAGAKDEVRPSTLVWAPEPEAAAPKEIPLPNVVAVAPPRIVRPFVAPPVDAPASPQPAPLAEPPRTTPNPVKADLALPPVKPTGAPRAFTPPPNERMLRQAMLPLPEGPAPAMVVEPGALPFDNVGPRPKPRDFVTPAAKTRAAAAATLPAPPEAAGIAGGTGAAKAGLEKVPRGYIPRNQPAGPATPAVIAAEPPALAGGHAQASLAIVGLNPAKLTEVPAPPASHAAGFSAGPETHAEGSSGANGAALLNVPGLVVKGGAKDTQPTLMGTFSPTSRETLLAAARIGAALPKPPPETLAPRMAEAPDPRFAGRAVYSIAIQMPNVTSFSGSWLVWFAEHIPLAGPAPREMRPPVVVHKVDPKYVAAAVAERVEGTVRLFAVIGRDGHVSGITLVRQLDERLDRTAREALAKWEFTPALRDGVPVEVDALFEIPFHLAPKPGQ